MDITLLEEQLKNARERKRQLSNELQIVQNESKKVENILGTDWWYINNPHIHAVNNGNEIAVEIPQNKHLYISYFEKNNDFSIYPSRPIYIEDELDYSFTGTVTNELNATLYLIGYKNKHKAGLHKLNINESGRLKLEQDNYDCFRIAIKISGNGSFSLKGIEIGALKIDGFKNNYSVGNTNKVIENNVDLNLENRFANVINMDNRDMVIPPQFTPFLKKEDGIIMSKLIGSSYAYIQYKDENPIFENKNLENYIAINNEKNYEFGFASMTDSDMSLELVLLGISEREVIEAKLVKNNSNELIRFNDETKFVKLLVRVQGQGEIQKVEVSFNEKERVANYKFELDKDSDKWFNPKDSQVELQKLKEQLVISSTRINENPAYLSYKAENNSFSKVPEHSVFDVNHNCNYEIIVNGDENGSGSITPIIVAYSNKAKEEILTLKLNELNKITFKENIVKVRVSFKVLGNSQLKLKGFNITEYNNLEDNEQIKWIESKEPSLLGLTKKSSLLSLKMAAIFDEFTAECFAHECDLITFTPKNWKETLTVTQPDLLMVESAWRGNKGTWTKKVQYTGEDSIKDLRELIDWCNKKNIPTIFWNKEDPVHYSHFLETAKLFDFVYTSDENMVPIYKKECGHNRVSSLMFAAQPVIHNPITIGERESGISFAGSFYKKHRERSEDMLKIFNQAMNYNLVIYDRNYDKIKLGLLANNRFPEHLAPFIRGSLKYYEIGKAYKGFKAMININTVKNSPTMFARRVYEALASGTPVISNYSEGVERIFGDVVYLSDDEDEIKKNVNSLFKNEEDYRKRVLKGLREVFEKHTYANRLEQIINFIKLPFDKEALNISAFAFANNLNEFQAILASYAKQTFDNKTLNIIVSDEVNSNIPMVTDPSIKISGSVEFFQQNANIVELVEGEYFAVLSHEETYHENYLKDLVLATLYAPWEIISSNPGKELVFEQVNRVAPFRSIFKANLFKTTSLVKTFESIRDNKDFNLILRMGARVLELPN